jgi:carbamoyl-phosphate synthase small subunit
LKKQLSDVPSMKGLALAPKVSTTEPYYVGDEDAPLKVACFGFGYQEKHLAQPRQQRCVC